MNQTTPENWERRTRQEEAEWDRQYREHLESAVDKIARALDPDRSRSPAFSKDELRALRMFMRKHYNEGG